MFKIVETPFGKHIQRVDGALIPQDNDNHDWLDYQNWRAAGNTPTPALASTKSKLAAYAAGMQANVLAAGVMVTVSAPEASPAVAVLCDGANATRSDLALLALYGQANPQGSKIWVDNKGVTSPLSGVQLVTLAAAVGNWIADTYAALAAVLAQIESGAITTTAQIDAVSWPTN